MFHQEQNAHREGDEKMALATTWDDFYVIGTPRKNDVPLDFNGLDGDAGHYVTSEVCHIDIKGDVGLALTHNNLWRLAHSKWYSGRRAPSGLDR